MKALNGFNDGIGAGSGIGGGKSTEEDMEDEAFLNRCENAIIVLRNLLRRMDLKLGQEAAESILNEIKAKRKNE